ncbi:glycosyltransferase 87 family protein [Phytomonospora sp. NPDC050363]|uniref:glycosyltransferase 87 family protein n=1 Tax=Phytomonospora sp. NPDC050363 TaxID=3155642 RepID=UPI0033D6A828
MWRLETRRGLPVDLILYGVSALFAGYTALFSTLTPHRVWGGIAFGGYLPAAMVTALLLARPTIALSSRIYIVAATYAATTFFPLIAEAVSRADGTAGRAQEEVLVVEQSGVRLFDLGTPYLGRDDIAALPDQLLGYNPYQPGMAVFGVPRAILGDGAWLADARIWFALATLAAVLVALRLLYREGAATSGLIRAAQAVTVLPICALTLATGGDDLPVLALSLLALVLASTGRWVWAAAVIGVAAALKLLAWPILAVLVVYAIVSGRWRRFVPLAVGIPVLVLLPAVLVDAAAVGENLIAFPTGHGLVESPAASPFPGHLIASAFDGGRVVALVLLGCAAAGMAVWMWRRPPRDGAAVSLMIAVGLLAAILLMPATRFGYLLYPAAFAVWWIPLRSILSVDQVPSWDGDDLPQVPRPDAPV